jgi:hypothetical protein
MAEFKLSTILGTIAVIFALVGSVWGASQYLASQDDIRTVDKKIELVDARLEQKIINDRSNEIQERIWKIEDRFGRDYLKYPERIKEDWRRLNQELKENDIKIQQRLKKIN